MVFYTWYYFILSIILNAYLSTWLTTWIFLPGFFTFNPETTVLCVRTREKPGVANKLHCDKRRSMMTYKPVCTIQD